MISSMIMDMIWLFFILIFESLKKYCATTTEKFILKLKTLLIPYLVSKLFTLLTILTTDFFSMLTTNYIQIKWSVCDSIHGLYIIYINRHRCTVYKPWYKL